MRFKSKLAVEVPLHDNGKRKLIEPLIHELVIVPRGFETDYASIPRAFWIVLAPTGKHTYAAVVHDYLYASGLKTKDEADKIFYDIMLADLDVDKWQAWTMNQAVKYFGYKAWNEHKLRRENEILSNFNNGIGV